MRHIFQPRPVVVGMDASEAAHPAARFAAKDPVGSGVTS
jgi:hypothetical protein